MLNSTGVRKPLFSLSRLSNTDSSWSGESGISPCSVWQPGKETKKVRIHFQWCIYIIRFHFLLITCMSLLVMNPFPSLSHRTNSSLASPMVCGWTSPNGPSLGDVISPRPWPDLGLPARAPLCLGVHGDDSPLPFPTNTCSFFSHLDITAEKERKCNFCIRIFYLDCAHI